MASEKNIIYLKTDINVSLNRLLLLLLTGMSFSVLTAHGNPGKFRPRNTGKL